MSTAGDHIMADLYALARDVAALSPDERARYARQEKADRRRALYRETLENAREFMARGDSPRLAVALAERVWGDALTPDQRRRMVARLTKERGQA